MIPGETVTSHKALGLPVDAHVSPFQVMHTPAGYYVGTVFTVCDYPGCPNSECVDVRNGRLPKGWAEPNSRETDYVATRAEAETLLAQMLAGETPPEVRTDAFNADGAAHVEVVELPPGSTAEDLYRAIHGNDPDPDAEE